MSRTRSLSKLIGPSGSQAFDTNTLVIDAANNRVGIGTSSPAQLLHLVKTDNSAQLRITGAADWDFYSYNDSSLYINNSTGTVLSLFANKNASFDGNVGIGTISPYNPGGYNRVLDIRGANGSQIVIGGTASNPTSTALQVDAANGNFLVSNNKGGSSLVFRTSVSDDDRIERIRIDSSGHLIAPYGITLGTAVGTYAAANTLDDYEEGTWTPVVADASSGGNVGSATMSYANYTKIGNKVTIAAQMLNIVTTGMTAGNVFYVRGLPFLSSTQISYGTCIPDNITFQGGRTGMVVQVSVADTWAIFLQYGSGLGDTGIDVGDLTSGTADINWSITYFTNA